MSRPNDGVAPVRPAHDGMSIVSGWWSSRGVGSELRGDSDTYAESGPRRWRWAVRTGVAVCEVHDRATVEGKASWGF